jgi:hypothetical protein
VIEQVGVSDYNSTPTAYFNTGAVQYYTTGAGANWTQNLAFSSVIIDTASAEWYEYWMKSQKKQVESRSSLSVRLL